MKTLKVKIEGVKPLILHNGQGANPIDNREMPNFLQKKFGCKLYREAIKPISSKRGKTEKDHINLSELSFYSSLYLNDKKQIILPAENLERMLETQAIANRKGATFKRAVSIDEDVILEFPNKNKPLKALYDLHKYIVMGVVSRSKVSVTRAIFPKWSATFKISYDPKQINEAEIKDNLALGEFYGSFERRPKFGRYKFKVVK